MSIVIFEPVLASFGGHYHRYVRVIAAEAQKRGESVAAGVSERILPEVRSYLERLDIDVLPVFPVQTLRIPQDRNVQIELCRVTARAALSAVEKLPDAKVTWLSGFPSYVESAATFAEQARRPFPFQLLEFSGEWPPGVNTAPHRIRRLLEKGVSHGMRLYAQTEFVAEQASRECGQQVLPFLPIIEFKELRPRRPRGRPRVGLMNCVRPDKNPSAAMWAWGANAGEVDFVVHARKFSEKSIIEEVLAYAKGIGAETYAGDLDPETYNRIWASLDAVVFSYYPRKYARSGSGMLYEALSDAIVPIVPDRTSLAALIREAGVGIVYDDRDPAGLSNAIKSYTADSQRLAAASEAFAPVWRERNSSSRLMDLLESAWAS